MATVVDLSRRRHVMARLLYRYQFSFQTEVQTLGGRGLPAVDMRIPLDVSRRQGQSLQWRPFSLNDNLVQTNRRLVDLLKFVSFIGQHAQLPTPVLMDINIHYRLMKMCYGERMLRWDVCGVLRNHPPLFGVWHAYKHVLTVLHRQYHSLWTHFKRGTCTPTDSFPWAIPVRSMEYYVGALRCSCPRPTDWP